MRRPFIFLLLCTLINLTYAHSALSLKGELANEVSQEIQRIDTLNELLRVHACSNDSLATIYYKEIMSLLKEQNYPEGKMQAFKQYGSMMYCQGKLDSIIYYQKKAALIGEKSGQYSFAGRMYCNLGFLFNNEGSYDSGLYYLSKAFDQGVLAEDSLVISLAYTGMGINARELGHFDKSLEMYLKALSISESRADTLGMLTAKMNLLNFYRDNRPELFLESELLELLHISKLVGQTQHEISAYEYLGYIKADSGAFDQAFKYIHQGLELNKTLKDNNRQISLLGALSYAHRKSGDFNLAIKYCNEAIENAIASGFLEYLPSLYAGNVDNHISLGSYQKAISDGKRALEYGEKLESVELYYRMLQKMAFAYNELGLSYKAYQTQLEYSRLSEKLLSSEKIEQMAKMQTKYETEKKETQIALLFQQASIQTLEIQQKNQAIIIGIVAILFILGTIYFIYKQRETKNQRSRMELEQRFLRSQLNPHFISNALVAVQNFMLKNDSESAALYLIKFSKLMREILENSRKEFIPVGEEINMLTNYLDIHKLRLGSFDFTIELDENIDPELDKIPPMFVQPFLENAIEHGIANMQDGKIELKIKKKADYISIEVRDNGKGISDVQQLNHHSLSTTIIKERMILFNKSLKNKIQLVMENLIDVDGASVGTIVQLKVPFS